MRESGTPEEVKPPPVSTMHHITSPATVGPEGTTASGPIQPDIAPVHAKQTHNMPHPNSTQNTRQFYNGEKNVRSQIAFYPSRSRFERKYSFAHFYVGPEKLGKIPCANYLWVPEKVETRGRWEHESSLSIRALWEWYRFCSAVL